MNAQPSQPRVACVIAVYNGEHYLHEAIDSLLEQTYPRVEVVVVDDGSTDGTPGVIAGYGERVRVIRQSNAGVSAARNAGVAALFGGDAAPGERDLLCFLDADDRMLPEKIARQVDAFTDDSALDLCDCHTRYFWSPELGPAQLAKDPRYNDPFWKKVLPGHISTWLFTRALWERVGGFEPGKRFAEDVDWFLRAQDMGMRRRTLPEALTERRLHAGNVIRGDREAQGDGLAESLMAHLRRARRAGQGEAAG